MRKYVLVLLAGFSFLAHAVETFPASPGFPEPEPPRKAHVKTKPEKIKAEVAAPVTEEAPAHPAAADAPAEPNWFTRNRSNPDALFWTGVNGSIVVHDAGSGAASQLNLRLKLGRCGVIADWHTQNIHIDDPGDISNNIVGLGAMCTTATFGKYHWFMRGAHIAASLLAEYGRTRYHLYQSASYSAGQQELAAGTDTSFGGTAGADLYFPILFGFWVNAGLGYEKMYFKYDLSTVRGTTSHVPNEMGYLRVGLSYGI